jgi:hypothetical protein
MSVAGLIEVIELKDRLRLNKWLPESNDFNQLNLVESGHDVGHDRRRRSMEDFYWGVVPPVQENRCKDK